MISVRRGQPYKSIFHNAEEGGEKPKSSKLNLVDTLDIFLKDCPIKCKISKLEDSHKRVTLMFNVELSHSCFKWTIQRSYGSFMKLNAKLEVAAKFKKDKISVPKFPFSIKSNEQLTKDLAEYLEKVLANDYFRSNKSMLKYLEVSWLSFIDGLGDKHREGFISKKVGHNEVAGILKTVQSVHSLIHTKWSPIWLVVKDSYLVVVRPVDQLIRDVILMDQGFYVDRHRKHKSRRYIKINNLNRSLVLKCRNKDLVSEWVNEINQVAIKNEDFTQPNRLESFAPVRNKILAKWFVDGASYFECVAEVLDKAQEEIFITDWMLSPELQLKRPITEDFWRLDKILERKAYSGVRIFIIIFEDVKIAMGLDSIYVKKTLEKLHPNIKVQRRRGFAQIMFWSPHDKMVIVDQQYAFFGGLDMCFGRWDNHIHRLTDLGNDESILTSNSQSVVSAFATRMADVPTLDISGMMGANFKSSLDVSKSLGTSNDNLISNKGDGLDKGHLWPGKDYMNFIYKDFQHVDCPFEDLIDRKSIARMPWHDIACYVQGPPARDLARHFIQRWNLTKLDNKKEDVNYPLILPKGYGSELRDLKPALTLMTRVDCQMLRSACNWSTGIQRTEHSIQNAYVKVISEAEHFIYIENQFFVSLMGGHSQVFNKVSDCLYERITRAHDQHKAFKVYVVMPLLPGIEGDITSATGVAIKAVTHYNYASICRGPTSLWGRLQEKVGNPSNYLTFCALRTHEFTLGKLLSELVYVHSKLIIADDRVAIIGSANINDRSLSGDRDCEVAAVFEDVHDCHDVTFAGTPCRVGHFVSSLRQHIFKEHLGMMENADLSYDLSDPVNDDFFNNVWQKTASKNTKIFEKVFRCIPNDSVRTLAQMEAYVKEPSISETDQEKALRKIQEIEGHLVLLPFFFLCDEELAPAINTKEGIMPNVLWT